LNFTPAERKVVLFLVSAFAVGLGVKLYRHAFPSYESFGYAAQDSQFAALSSRYNERSAGPAPAGDSVGGKTGIASDRKNPPRPGKSATVLATGSIDVNSASAAELTKLPGIGPALAERIVAYRETHGRFASVGELNAVKGIGDKILARISPYCRVE
jgi:competence ComEA-like helix-hairpin-helix protein